MKRFFLALIAAGWAATPVAAQPIPLYENFGQVTYRIDIPEEAPPLIDALAFANYGSFEITNVVKFNTLCFLNDLGLPYEPSSVLNFTNRGRMQAMFGFLDAQQRVFRHGFQGRANRQQAQGSIRQRDGIDRVGKRSLAH